MTAGLASESMAGMSGSVARMGGTMALGTEATAATGSGTWGLVGAGATTTGSSGAGLGVRMNWEASSPAVVAKSSAVAPVSKGVGASPPRNALFSPMNDEWGGALASSGNHWDTVVDKLASGKRREFPTRWSPETGDLRHEFDTVVRPQFLREYAGSQEAARRFSSVERQLIMERGELPRGWIVHHKKPLFRGGGNDFSNFRVMRESFHIKFDKRLHSYPEGRNPYGAN